MRFHSIIKIYEPGKGDFPFLPCVKDNLFMPHLHKCFDDALGLAVGLRPFDARELLPDALCRTQGCEAMRGRSLVFRAVVRICEGAFGYDGALRIGAIADLFASQESDDDERLALIERLHVLHKRLKYGLPHTSAITLYEFGFADRVVAQHLSSIVGNSPITRSVATSTLIAQQQAAGKILSNYPKYFINCLTGLIS